MNLDTGDLILTSKDSIVVKFMNWVQKKDPVFWGHVIVVRNSTTAWEANWVTREISLVKVFRKHKYYKIIRKKDLTDRQKEIMLEVAPKLLGHIYSVWRIFLQFLNKIFDTVWFTDIDTNAYSQVCSSLAAWIYEMSCRYKFNGISWQSCDPDDIEDDQIAHPEIWEVIVEKRSIGRK